VSYAPLRKLVQPYILRRLKSDKAIIGDLPTRPRIKAFYSHEKAGGAVSGRVAELEAALEEAGEGIGRRGLVLSFADASQQICNHPSQWLGRWRYDEAESGSSGA